MTRHPLDTSAWPVRLVGRYAGDSFLQVAYEGGNRRLEFFLYGLTDTRGRLSWLDGGGLAEITEYGANRVLATVDSSAGGRVVLTDLAYPGWEVRVDGRLAESVRVEGMYRGVDVPGGLHRIEWVYRPMSVFLGAVISGLSLLILVIGCLVSRRRLELVWGQS